MLFRPLEEKRIFGFRIPFTPGLIPRKRKEIAENIGEAISSKLVTSEGISRRLDSEAVRAKIEMAIYEKLDYFLNREWPSLEEIVPEQFRGEFEELVERGEKKARKWIKDFLESEKAEKTVRSLVGEFLESQSDRRLRELVGEEERDVLLRSLRRALVDFSERDELEEEVEKFWRSRIDELLEQEKEIGRYLPREVRRLLHRELGKWTPELVAHASKFLQDKQIRKKIKMYLFDLIDELVEEEFNEESAWAQLKLGVLETFVMSVDKMKIKVDEAVDEGLPKLAEIMKREEVQEQIKESAVDYVDDLLEKDLSDLEPSAEGREKLARSLTEFTVGFIRTETIREAFMGQAENVLDEVGERRVGDFLDEEERNSLASALSDMVLSGLRGERLEEEIDSFVRELSGKIRSRNWGPFGQYVKEDWVEDLRSFLSRKTVDLLVEKMPDIINALDVSMIVEEEVEEFSLRDVEGLILDVTGNQLRSITWFGAIIGFLIGLVQLSIIWLGV